MKVEIQGRPSFAHLVVELARGERLIVENDAMVSMSANVSMKPKMRGGFFAALGRRLFGKEAMFINEFFLERGETGELVLTQAVPGDVVEHKLDGKGLYLQPGAFIACTEGVELHTRWAGFTSWFSGEGLYRQYVTGRGTLWFGACGTIVKKEIQGEYIVDTTHLVAYEPTLTLHIALAGGGIFTSFFSGEGFVSRLEGTGVAYLQTRSLQGIASWINPYLV